MSVLLRARAEGGRREHARRTSNDTRPSRSSEVPHAARACTPRIRAPHSRASRAAAHAPVARVHVADADEQPGAGVGPQRFERLHEGAARLARPARRGHRHAGVQLRDGGVVQDAEHVAVARARRQRVERRPAPARPPARPARFRGSALISRTRHAVSVSRRRRGGRLALRRRRLLGRIGRRERLGQRRRVGGSGRRHRVPERASAPQPQSPFLAAPTEQ